MLVLTYLTEHNDGFGAQYQRILGIYSICRELDILYYHTPFCDIEYQGLNALIKNKNSDNFTNEINKRIHIESDIESIDGFTKLKFQTIDIESLLRLKKNTHKHNKNVIVYLKLPYSITDKFSNMYLHTKNLYETKINKNNIFTIGIHVRRGELYVVDSHRMLPNHFYIDNCNKIIEILNNKKIPFKVELYTEIPDKKYDISGKHPGINNRIKGNVIIDPSNNNIQDFDCLSNLEKYINEDILLTFDRMINCDILIASKSSLSACASYIKQGVTVYQPFWHNLISSDIRTNDNNFNDDISNFIEFKNHEHIPMKCMQVWMQGEVPTHVKSNILKLNKNIDYTFFREQDCLKFLTDNFDSEVVTCFKKINNLAHKCDLFRYCYLYKNGGIYLDVDIELRTSFEEIIKLSNYSDFITCQGAHSNERFGECTNGIILCKRGNKLFHDLIDKIIRNPNPRDYGLRVKEMYNAINPTVFSKFIRKDMSFYLYKEVMMGKKYYIVDHSNHIIINTNGHDYLHL